MATTTQTRAGVGAVQPWTRAVRLTALHREHVAAGADLVERDGWLLPRSYGNPEAERAALRETVGLIDLGASGKIDVKSDDLEAALATLREGETADPSIPRLRVSALAQGIGAYRLTEGQALVITAPQQLEVTLGALQQTATPDGCTHVTDLSGALCGLRLQGPNAPALLERLSPLDLAPDRFAEGALAQGALSRVQALIARRDASGVPGYDVYVDRDLGSYLWDSLIDQGAPLGIKPVGYEVARD
jgi:heterotetrameric sarcosine oxidase gamma subunit